MLNYLEQRLSFKPTSTDYGGLTRFNAARFRFGGEFGLDLNGAFFGSSSRHAVLFIHGNKHNLTKFAAHYELFSSIGAACLSFDYPGYGASSGTPSEERLYASARAAYSHLRYVLGYAPEQIIVYGCSMGGAVALELLQHVPAAGLITESTFTNSLDMSRYLYPYLPVWKLVPNRFRNDQRMPRLRLPLFMIHGEADLVVPVTMAHQLYALASCEKSLMIVPRATHINSIELGAEPLRAAVASFIDKNVTVTN